MKVLYFTFLFCITHLSPVLALESPQLSEKLCQNAEEHLKVEVIQVEHQNFSNKAYAQIYVKARVKVLSVRRSHNDLKYNYQINLNYLHSYKKHEDGTPAPGPSILPILENGQILTVFLNRIEGIKNTYKPAALGRSFQF